MTKESDARNEKRFDQITESIKDMSTSVSTLAEATVRYEERASAQTERVDGLEKRVNSHSNKIDKITTSITINNVTRKAAIWFAALITSAVVGGGVTFGFWLLK